MKPSTPTPSRRSPFRPSFGSTPPTAVGLGAIVGRVEDALVAGPGHPARAVMLTGTRGIGKTVALNEIEAVAREHGWLVVSETLTPGFAARLLDEHVPAAWRDVRGETGPDPAEPRTRRRLSGVSLPGRLGLSFDTDPPEGLTGLRANLAALCDALEARGSGVLVTVDEIHRLTGGEREGFEVFAGTVQHLVREERAIAFAGAGLPAAVQDLLNDRVITFLRRAERFDLELLGPDESAEAIREPVEAHGRRIEPAALDAAVDLASGYPYMLQLVGDAAWNVDRDSDAVTAAHVASIRERVIRAVGRQVHEPAVRALSPRDLDYLLAMLEDAGPTAISDLNRRLDVTHSYTARYRSRLIAQGLVRPAGRGRVELALPYLRDYLRTLDV